MKFAIIGCGRISKNHVRAIADNVDCMDLVALCDVNIEKTLVRKKEYIEHVPKAEISMYEDYKLMLEKEDIDVCAICTESGYHASIAINCLNAGKHVLVEKPMAMSVEDASKMIRIADEKDLNLGVCHQNRFNPPIQRLRKAIEEGRFGKIINITARILWTRDMHYYEQAPWRGTKDLDGGTLMNQCIHNIDLLQWMSQSEVKRVRCEKDTFMRDIEMEDFGAIMIRFDSGTIGMVEGSACVYPKNLEETLSIFGERGTVVIGGKAVNEVKTWDFEDSRDYDNFTDDTDIDNVYGKGHTPLYRDFAEAVNEHRDSYISGKDGIKALKIILNAYEDVDTYLIN